MLLNLVRLQNCIAKCKRAPQTIMDIKSFVFLDLETTGLPQYSRTTKITELSLIAVQSCHIQLGITPRVQNKLTLCFNPRKFIDPVATEITGLCNELLEFQSEFNPDMAQLINQFLKAQQQPICLIAHNGSRFDYPILQTELKRIGFDLWPDIVCVDSLTMFRKFHKDATEQSIKNEKNIPVELCDDFDELLCSVVDGIEQDEEKRLANVLRIQKENETTPKKDKNKTKRNCDIDVNFRSCFEEESPSKCQVISSQVVAKKIVAKKKLNYRMPTPSFKLTDVYERLLNKPAFDSHKAECDALLLLECSVATGDNFLKYCNENAKLFSEIPVLGQTRK